MSRRRRSDDSSLELLLDTICNTFGGVLFLAMLVSLLLQATRNQAAPSAADQPPKPAISKADVIRLSTETREMEAELEQLDTDLVRVRGFVRDFSTPGFAESLDQLHAEQKKQRDLEARRVELLVALAADKTAAATTAAGAMATRDRAKDAETTSRDAAALLETAQEKHDKLVRSAILLQEKVDKKNVIQSTGKAPRERDTDKREFGVLMRYGRMYLTHIHTGFSRVVNTKDFTIVEGIGLNKATARPGAGIDICGAAADAQLQELLEIYPPATWYPCIVVHPDSYDAFQVLKAKLVNKGYEYRVVATNKPVADQGGQGRVQ